MSSENNSVLDSIAKAAHSFGDPGLLFYDHIRENQPIPFSSLPSEWGIKNDLSCSVPCGELNLYENETCNLGSINVPRFFDQEEGLFDSETFCATVTRAVEFLDFIVDELEIPDEQMQKRTRLLRRLGLGIMGWADYLNLKGIKYDSDEAIDEIHYVGSLFDSTAKAASKTLARKKGPLHPSFPHRRNISLTALPPTGGITLLTENKGWSIEPFFAEATSIDPLSHLRVQGVWQMYIENSISKTINMKETATVDDVKKTFRDAFFLDRVLLGRDCSSPDGRKPFIKSVTVYRDNCRVNPISLSSSEEALACKLGGGACL